MVLVVILESNQIEGIKLNRNSSSGIQEEKEEETSVEP